MIAIQETWLNQSHSDDQVKISGYSIVRCDRPGRGGGGVAFYISDRVGWSIPDVHKIDQVEYLCLDIHVGRRITRICNVYRPHSPIEWMENFKKVLDLISATNYDVILVGDYNIDFLIPSMRNLKMFTPII